MERSVKGIQRNYNGVDNIRRPTIRVEYLYQEPFGDSSSKISIDWSAS